MTQFCYGCFSWSPHSFEGRLVHTSRYVRYFRMSLSCSWLSISGFILRVTLSPFINNEHTSRSQCGHEGLYPLGPLASSRMRSHSASASICSRSSRFGSWSPLSAWPLTHAYVPSVLLYQLCCRYFIVAIKSWYPSVLWKMLCVSSLFDSRIAALLSHINLMRLALIRPDRRIVPSTARPDIMPPSSDLHDVTTVHKISQNMKQQQMRVIVLYIYIYLLTSCCTRFWRGREITNTV
jgi:hypothetical protein